MKNMGKNWTLECVKTCFKLFIVEVILTYKICFFCSNIMFSDVLPVLALKSIHHVYFVKCKYTVCAISREFYAVIFHG